MQIINVPKSVNLLVLQSPGTLTSSGTRRINNNSSLSHRKYPSFLQLYFFITYGIVLILTAFFSLIIK
jgi:hypothetical protein